jgi:hypothetical protein
LFGYYQITIVISSHHQGGQFSSNGKNKLCHKTQQGKQDWQQLIAS